MAVFRNVMAFLGLDDDDQMYDDEAYYDEEDEHVENSSRQRKTIALDERLSADDAPSFGFSADTEMNEMGGVGAVRPLRPVPSEEPGIPEALSGGPERRINQPDTAGAFDHGVGGPNGVDQASPRLTGEQPHTPTPGGGEPRLMAVDSPSPKGDSAPTLGGLSSDRSVETPRPSLSAVDGTSAMAHRQSKVEEPQNNVVTHAKPRLHIPSSFDDASRIADDFRAGAPVVMNLSKVEKPIARRLVDFASGVCYALTGGMERVAPNVYLLTPVGIDVSPEDRRRMQERGFDR